MRASALVVAGLYSLPAVVWAVIAHQQWWYVRLRRPSSPVLRLVPLVAGAFALHYALLVGLTLAPAGFEDDPWRLVQSPLHLAREVPWLAIAALLRHLVRLAPIPERRPSASWIAGNYGLAAVAAAGDAWMRLQSGAPETQRLGHHVFEAGFFLLAGLTLLDLWRIARPGAWGPEHAGEVRRPDLILIASGCAAAMLTLPLLASLGRHGLGHVAYEVIVGLVVATPFALRMLGAFVRQTAVTVVLLGAAGAVLAARSWATALAGSPWRPVLDVATVLAMGGVFVPGRRWLLAVVDRRVLGRGEREHAELLAYLHTVYPEIGIRECCRRALAELVQIGRAHV